MKKVKSASQDSAQSLSTPKRTPRAYQSEAINKFTSVGAFFAKDMRLGKSLTAIWWMQKNKAFPLLIVAPTTVLLGWEVELEKEGIDGVLFPKGLIKNRAQEMVANESAKIVLINYESVPKLLPTISNFGFKGIIADETTAIKNATAKQTKAMLKARKGIKFAAGLSGLPCPETWFDIFTQMVFAHGSFMGCTNFYEWRLKIARKEAFNWVISPRNKDRIKQAYDEAAFTLTRTDAGYSVGKSYKIINVAPTVQQLRLQREIVKNWEIPGLETVEQKGTTKYAMVVTSWLRRMYGGFLPGVELESNKYAETLKIIKALTGRNQVVIWCAFNDELLRLQRYLRALPLLQGRVLNGVTKREWRKNFIQDFRLGKFKVALVQQQCGKFGLDFSTADTVIYFSNPYSYEIRAQTEDRVVMPGKEKDAVIYDLVTTGTIEEEIMQQLADKKSDAGALLGRISRRFGLADNRSRANGNRVGTVVRGNVSRERVRFFIGERARPVETLF